MSSIDFIKSLSVVQSSTVSINPSNGKRKMLGNTENQTWGCCVRSKYATSLLCSPPPPCPPYRSFFILASISFWNCASIFMLSTFFAKIAPSVFIFHRIFKKSKGHTKPFLLLFILLKSNSAQSYFYDYVVFVHQANWHSCVVCVHHFIT